MDKATLRIISKAGLFIVLIGFFMPLACNQNGFQIAEYSAMRDGQNALSLSLYAIFFLACIGVLLLLLLVMKKTFSQGIDWVVICGTIIAAIVAYIEVSGFAGSDVFGSRETGNISNMLQSGAYVILFGLIISAICQIMASIQDDA